MITSTIMLLAVFVFLGLSIDDMARRQALSMVVNLSIVGTVVGFLV